MKKMDLEIMSRAIAEIMEEEGQGRWAACQKDCGWERFDDASMLVAVSEEFAKNACVIAGSLLPGISSISFDCRETSGLRAILGYSLGEVFGDDFEALDREEMHDGFAIADALAKDDEAIIERDVKCEISRGGVFFVSQTESGSFEIGFDLAKFRSAMEKAFAPAPDQGMA